MIKLAVFACVLASALGAAPPPRFSVNFEWNVIQYNWPTPRDQEQANATKEYIAANNAIAGIKLWKDKMYLSIPRWKSGIPVTLAVTSATLTHGNIAPKLDPYPNWDMQTLGDCNALQSVQSMEIDPLGRMWVLDTGRTETMTVQPAARCPPRLVIMDLQNEGKVLRSYEFPDEVARKDAAYLNDIVLDHDDGGMAYITDNAHSDFGIIVYSLRDNRSWKVKHDSMKADSEAVSFIVADTRVTTPIDIDGIALSPPGPNRMVYYSPMSSFKLYSIPASVLKNSTLKDVSPFVVDLGRKISQSAGMVMTNQGSLYLGLLADDAIAQWDSKNNPSFNTGVRTIARNHALMQWPDTFAIDEGGRLWCVTNQLQNYITNFVNVSQPNYRVLRSDISAKNYQYFEDGTAPNLTTITAAADRINFALSTCLTITLVYIAR